MSHDTVPRSQSIGGCGVKADNSRWPFRGCKRTLSPKNFMKTSKQDFTKENHEFDA